MSLLLLAGFATGCKPKPSNPGAYFKTPFQDESQYIVDAVVSDVAEQMFYAKFHRLPDPKRFQVTATEKPGSPLDEPVYELKIRLGSKTGTVSSEVNVNGAIWSPVIYRNVAEDLAQAVGLSPTGPVQSDDTTLLSKLTDSSAETIEEQNGELSLALQNDFTNPALHEEAALLLGAFTLREHSGNFYEIRSPLSRMTAHLTMARFLAGSGDYSINGRMAEAMLLTLIGDQAPALKRLDTIRTNDPAAAAFIRALRARNTGDYRQLSAMDGLTRVESLECFAAMADYVNAPAAWNKLTDEQKRSIGFVRIAYQEDYSVEMGHQLLTVAVPLELREISAVYALSHRDKLTKENLVKVLNEMPERCFTVQPGGKFHVRIIGWGQWAMFFQRQLCHAIVQDYRFLQYMWGVPDEAKAFAAKCDQAFDGLRLYPFVRRFDCSDVESYHKAVDDGFKVTLATPQLVPAECWNYLCYRVNFAPLYKPNPNPHVNEWHHHNPPPGTVYDLTPRLDHPSLIDRPDAVAFFEKLRQLAPYDCRVINFILKRKYNDKPTYEQALALFHDVLPYSATALETVAWSVRNQPGRYEKLMLQAAALNPPAYYTLGDYFLNHQAEDKAAEYYDKAADADPDSVRVSNYALWRVRYWLKKGETAKARDIAAFAGEVYSERGLQAEGLFFELTSNYDEAFDWYSKIQERYHDSEALVDFCARYRAKTGSSRFDSVIQAQVKKLFPKGTENVSFSDFHGPPTDGVVFKNQSDLLTAAGLKAGDVIVAVNGIRVHNTAQYDFGRGRLGTPEMDLIVWQGNAYRELTASPPDHLFGVDIGDYTPR